MKLGRFATLGTALALALTSSLAAAETRVTLKAAKAGTSYYQMAVQIGETVKAASGSGIIVTVEESQGSVQNVMESTGRGSHYMFTSPPALVEKAVAGEKPFEPADEAFKKIRGMFPIPSLTMHYVVRADAGINSFADLAGKRFVTGKGSFGATEAVKTFKQLGLEGKVDVIDIELSGAGAAMKNRQVDGFASAGSWPAPNVVEVAASSPVRLLSMTEEQVMASGRTRLVIPKGTYPGVDHDVVTTSLPVVAYALSDMDEATAYQLTRAYWEGLAAMAKSNPWWKSIDASLLDNITVKLHPGALKYYREAGIAVPEHLK
ncbi:TAXI family TRAP transporter solute-binding subunit [Denitromonas iodatirespirans]|uniref:TAXI family TRAP transporter solute-binding subunit n=1 Tax=Denitromonas iodatirespirans TaxID=2795389 RepID=A0A944DCE3_DENI1|nr:TAXI family TRAP transporter solute-binding subunit [Denitromonas iodatirespirans]MBT0963914.1 TAXI family TRAP transporter solute-binding subunit [Denitromonas iodatirespirans]